MGYIKLIRCLHENFEILLGADAPLSHNVAPPCVSFITVVKGFSLLYFIFLCPAPMVKDAPFGKCNRRNNI